MEGLVNLHQNLTSGNPWILELAGRHPLLSSLVFCQVLRRVASAVGDPERASVPVEPHGQKFRVRSISDGFQGSAGRQRRGTAGPLGFKIRWADRYVMRLAK